MKKAEQNVDKTISKETSPSEIIGSDKVIKNGKPTKKNSSKLSNSSAIKLKEVKEFIPESESVFSSTLLSPKSSKNIYKGPRLFK